MRFAIVFAGCLIAFATDAKAVFDVFPYFLIIIVMAILLYLDIVTLTLANIDELKKITKDKKV